MHEDEKCSKRCQAERKQGFGMTDIIRKFEKILNKKQKKRVIILAIMMVIGAGLETLGVGMILPLVSAIMSPDMIQTNKYVRFVCEILDLHTTQAFLMAMIAAMIAVYLFKNVYLFFEYYVQYRFICNNRYGVQRRLVQVYMHRPYEFFLHAESGEIVRVVTEDTKNTFILLQTLLSLFTEAVIACALVLTIIAADPLMAFLLGVVFGVLMLLITAIIKPILKTAGIRYQDNNAQSNKWLLQAITGMKEIKVAGKETFFEEQFARYGRRSVDSERKYMVLGQVPRLAIEAFGISAMLAVIAILMWRGREIELMLPQLSAFAMAAVRLLPSMNRMSSSLNSLSYYEPALDTMLEHLTVAEKWENEDSSNWMKNNAVQIFSAEHNIEALMGQIELSDITYTYPNAVHPVLEHTNMVIPVGKSVGVVGSSGSGKTTAIDILLGLLPPQGGVVLADGVNIWNDYQGWLSRLAYIPQTIFMLDDTIRANVAFGIPDREIDDVQVWRVLYEAQLSEFVRSLPDGLHTKIGERGVRLSGGQRQRIGIARALYTDPELLIFDEATSALDNETESAIMDSIHALRGQKTMIIIAHRLSTIEECDLLYRVENGKIVQER